MRRGILALDSKARERLVDILALLDCHIWITACYWRHSHCRLITNPSYPGSRGPVKITIRLFAGLRERAGTDAVVLDLATGATVADAVASAQGNTPRRWRVSRTTLTAVNEEYADASQVLADGDELALIPPVSGGATESRSAARPEAPAVTITEQRLDPEAVATHVRRDSDGAVVVFEGVTRNHNEGRPVRYLEYEAYRPMADKIIGELINEISTRWEIDRVAVAHRIGRVDIGETSLVVAVSAAHRRPAFEAALHFVDRLKQVVPIWKKEYFEGGEVWIGDEGGPTRIQGVQGE